MAAPEAFAVTVQYKTMSFSYRSEHQDAREVLKELANKNDVMYDWLNAKITLRRIEKEKETQK